MKKRNQSPHFKKKLVWILAVLLAVDGAAICLLGILPPLFGFSLPAVIIMIAAAVSVFAVLIWRFVVSIYAPIKKVEKALEVVSDVEDFRDFEIKIDDNSDMFDLASYLNGMMQKFRNYAEREYTASLLVKQAELNALQTQINPHFLYNTLDSIRGVALLEGQEQIASMTKALSGLFRYSISKKDNLSTLSEEIKNASNYMTIQQMRFPDKFVFLTDIDVLEDSDIMSLRIPKLTLQPLVENAVFHGLETKLGTGRIIIHAYKTETRLVITVEDDGVGIESEKLRQINERLLSKAKKDVEHVSSIALSNVNERIKMYFGDDFGIKIRSTEYVGTAVEISVPIVQDNTVV